MTPQRWLLFFFVILAQAIALAAAEHTKDPLDKVKRNLDRKEAVLIDVREQSEWDRGHLKDARLLPLSELRRASSDAGIKEKIQKQLPKDRIIYCHCAKGVRALTAGALLEKMGYDVRPLESGYEQLRDSGFPTAEK